MKIDFLNTRGPVESSENAKKALEQDVMERMETENAQSQAELNYRELIESIQAIVWRADAETFQFSFVSKEAEFFLGYPVRDWTDSPTFWMDHLHPDDRDWAVNFCTRAVREKRNHQFEYRMIAANGQVVWFRDIVRVVVEGDRAKELIGVMVDVTERKLVEEAFEQLRRQNELILNSAGEGIYGLDLAGRVTFVNPAAAKMLGYVIEELIGQAMHGLLHHSKPDGSPYPQEECPIYAAFRDGKTHRVTNEVFWRKDGTCFPVEYVSTPIRDKGALIGAVVTFNDVTERKRADEQIRRNLEHIRGLYEISLATTSTLDLPSLLENLLQKTALLFPHSAATVRLLNAQTGQIERLACRNLDEEAWKARMSKGGGPITKIIVETKAPLQIRNLQTDDRIPRREYFRKEGLVSYLGVPLIAKGEVLGILGFFTKEEHDFSSEELELASTLAGQAAVAIHNSRLHEQVNQQADTLKRANEELSARTRQQAVVAHIGHLALAETDIPALLNDAAMLAAQTLQTEYSGVLELLPDGKKLLLRAGWGWKEDLLGLATLGAGRESPAGYTLLSGTPVVFEDPSQETRFNIPALLAERGITSGVSAIIRGKERAFGVLEVETTRRRRFTDGHFHFLESLANLLATAIERKRTEEALRKSEERYRTLFEDSRDGIYITSEEGRFVDVNLAALRLLGYSRDEIMRLSPRQLYVAPNARKNFQREIERSGSVRDYEIKLRKKDGAQLDCLITSTIRRADDGTVLGYQGILRDITERKLAEERLRISREQLRALSAHLQSAREEERAQIAREIHDELGQAMTGLKMDLTWLNRRLAKDQAALREKIQSMLALTEQTIQAVRRISTQLRPSVLDDLGLEAAIEWQTQDFEARTGIRCHLISNLADGSIDERRATAIFRIFQEALTNITRHSNATRIKIKLAQDSRHVMLQVKDNGRGIDERKINSPRSLGLIGMRERAGLLGGEVKFNGAKGTTVTVRIPLTEPQTAAARL